MIVESAVDFAIVATDTSGKITEWNSGAEKVLGWSADEICGQPLDRFFTPEDRVADRPAIEMRLSLTEGHAADERWHLKKDGTRFWANGEMMPLHDDEGNHTGFVKILRDRTDQRDAAAAHQADAEFLRSVLASSGDCIKVLDLDGRLTFMSEGGQRVMEVSDFNAVEGCPWPDFWEREGNAHAKAALVEARAGRSSSFRGDAATLKGNWKSWDVQVTPILDADGRPSRILAVSRDVTEHRRADRLRFGLADLGDRLRTEADVDTMQAAASEVIGKALGVDRVGYGSMEEDGETFTVPTDWTVPECPSLAGTYRIDDYGDYAVDLRAGSTVVIDDIRRDPRTSANPEPLAKVWVGSLINHPVMENGRIGAILFVNDKDAREWREDEIEFVREAADRLRQASERRRAELELSELNKRLESEVEARTADRNRLWSMSADIMLVAGLDARIHAVNPAWERVLGWTEDELVGTSLFDLIHPDDLAHTVEGASAIGEGRTLLRFENRYREKNGGYRYISWTAGPGDGLIVAVGRDTTIERAQAEVLAETEEQLRQSQKMEAVGQLTGGVAHDFNNLLTVIRGSVDLLRRPDLPEVKRQRYIDAVSDTVDRAARLTGQLLAFARRQSLIPAIFDVRTKLGGVGDMLDTVTGTHIQVATDLPDHPCYVRADASQFETALVNLSVNARDAMDGLGRLEIRVRCGVALPPIRGHGGSSAPFTSVSVRDTGVGIPPDQLGRIFEPFYTTKEVGNGTGLGLSQVFGFAKQSGGDIDVQSTVGEGTIFTLYLPEVLEPELAPEVEEKPSAAPIGAGLKVLIVEDNVEVGQFCTQVLEDLGYRTEWVPNAENALDLLGDDGDGYDVVFSDVVMPGIGGLALAEKLRTKLPNLPVILTSGYSHVLATDSDHGFELLHKPYSADMLGQTLRKVSRRFT
ncbi:PAS domain S-box protein [Sphingomonas nostoxanthinifaciens]|uniref:PAS domain S-box protein n=1 Tax=Sphingomonas nostoxanthinifaciens TaxID=2872652 RepID=UPI0021DA0080|nr:PAS domain S-box protein [Sphingomonas nostoxanthinifaciens]UAK25725.1 PAS domain S-box protein [Sphingomonas nostoxanthinifaciens]